MLSFSSTSAPKSFFSGLLSSLFPPNLYLCLGLPCPRWRTLHLAWLTFVRFAQVHLSSLSKVPLDGIPSLQHVDCATQLGVISKLAESALYPTVRVSNKDVKQHWSQYRPPEECVVGHSVFIQSKRDLT
ncbi:solute carrier family 22 member 7- hypothetical protein [Limosa lapponica baueri]|uniref:Uncharacterized protein n=1 Tax=Limosa lapponica baueri TaxID=1758121 RepID=A0A2I0UT76_LIMLA|nr:solute carrier family 22 member 7- hypothetical protein [Limosa lapponica baueri]